MRVVWTGPAGVVYRVMSIDGDFESSQKEVVQNVGRAAC